jgi:hypothetical protein
VVAVVGNGYADIHHVGQVKIMYVDNPRTVGNKMRECIPSLAMPAMPFSDGTPGQNVLDDGRHAMGRVSKTWCPGHPLISKLSV